MPQPQQQQNFPQASLPLVEASGQMNFEWYAFLRSLWTKLGAGRSQTGMAIYLQQDSSGVIGVYVALTGARLGSLTVSQP